MKILEYKLSDEIDVQQIVVAGFRRVLSVYTLPDGILALYIEVDPKNKENTTLDISIISAGDAYTHHPRNLWKFLGTCMHTQYEVSFIVHVWYRICTE